MTPEQNKKEIEYRIAKWMILNLLNDNLITSEEKDACIKELLEELSPPTKSVECIEFTINMLLNLGYPV